MPFNSKLTPAAATGRSRQPSPWPVACSWASLRAGRHRLHCLLPYRHRRDHGLGGVRAISAAAGSRVTTSIPLPLLVLRVWLGAAMAGNGMYLHFFALGVLAACIALGFCYRASIVLFFVGFTYAFLPGSGVVHEPLLLDRSAQLPADLRPGAPLVLVGCPEEPADPSATAPAWTLWLLMAQMGIVYFYGGLAKMNGDWLRGEPMRTFLRTNTDFPIIGSLFTGERMVYLFAYGGLLLDLLIVPFLLWRRTRLSCLRAGARLSRHELAAVQYRHLPVARDRRHHALLFTFLAPAIRRLSRDNFWRNPRQPRLPARSRRAGD